jgi:hypothetical protein
MSLARSNGKRQSTSLRKGRASFTLLRRWDLFIVTNTKASLCSDVLSERVLYAIFHRASVKYCVIRAFTRVAGRRSYNTKLALFIYLDKRYHCQRNPDYNDSWMFEVHWRIAHYYHSCVFHQYIRWYLNTKIHMINTKAFSSHYSPLPGEVTRYKWKVKQVIVDQILLSRVF